MRAREINQKKRSKIERCNSEETQTDSPEICHRSNSSNKEEILSKYLRIEAHILALKCDIKCGLSDMMIKMESLFNGVSNGFLYQSSENMKENLSFLHKELLAKHEFIKSLLETQTAIPNALSNSKLKPVFLSLSCNCSVQNEV